MAGLRPAPRAVDGLVRAGLAHVWFVTLHPFEDGNGRLARAISDMAISQDEHRPQRLFSLSAQIMRQRDAYYEVLERTQSGTLDVTPWLAWFLEQVALACDLAGETIEHRQGTFLVATPGDGDQRPSTQGDQRPPGCRARQVRRRHEYAQVCFAYARAGRRLTANWPSLSRRAA